MTRNSDPQWTSQRQALYRQLLDEGLDADALSRLLANQGPELLDASVPYIVVAARNRVRDELRRERRRPDLERESVRESNAFPSSVRDPAEIALGKLELDDAIRALGELDPAESWPLWWHAAGFTDDEIVELCVDAGFDAPTAAALRKRRERTRRELRRRLGR